MYMEKDALSIDDILERVLLFADKRSLATCSIISKQWSPLANRVLWTSLDSQRPLLELLAPLRMELAYDYDDEETYEALGFDKTQSVKWERFDLYAPFVKRLKIQPFRYGPHYHDSVITTVALWRKTFSLLPNLEELVVHCRKNAIFGSYPLDFASLFLSTSLKEVHVISDKSDDIKRTISVLNSGIRSFDALLDAIPTRSPDLRTISFWAGDREAKLCAVDHRNNKSAWIISSLAKLLPSLHKLEKIILCPGFIRPHLLRALSELQNIKCMQLQCDSHSICNPTEDPGIQRVRYTDFGSDQCSINYLEELLLATSFRVASEILWALEPQNLTYLDIKVHQIEPDSNSHLSQLISQLNLSPRLVELHLEVQGPKERLPGCSLGSKTLLQLSTLTQMRSFSFIYPYQIRLSQSDFEQLVSHWPLLEELHLITGLPKEKPHLSPHILTLLAQHCPHLRKLTISINWDKIDVQMDEGVFLRSA